MKLTNCIVTIFMMISLSAFTSVKTDRDFVDSLNDLSYDLAYSMPDSALSVARHSIKKSQEIGYTNGEITAFLRAGMIHDNMGNTVDSALFYYRKAENCYNEKGKDIEFLIKVYIYQAGLYDRIGQSDKSLQKNYLVYELSKRDSNELLMGMALLNMSTILIDQDDYTHAIRLLQEALELFPKENSQEIGSIYFNFGNIYEKQHRNKDAIDYFAKAAKEFLAIKNDYLLAKALLSVGNNYLNLERADSALFYYNQSYALCVGRFESINGQIYHNKGALFQRKGQLDSAQFFYEKSLSIKEKNNDSEGLLFTLENLGEIAFLKGKTQRAHNYYLAAYKFSRNQNDLMQLKILSGKLSTTALQLNNIDSSYYYLELSNAYQDSLAEKISESLVYEINYNKEKHKVAELELAIKNKNLELEKNTNLLWFISLFSFLGFILLVILYRLSKQRRKAIQHEKENLEAKQKITELINNQEKEALSAMYDGQEKERNRIALDLHDKLGAILSTVKLYFKSIDSQINQLKEENIKQYHKASNLLDEACDETRKIAHQLSSKNLGRIGLFSTIKMFQDQVQDSGQLKFSLTTHGDDSKLDGLNQISIYRIIQELVNNIMKHAHATEINLQLNVFDDLFNLVIEDDGIGFDINNLIDNHGMGLKETEVRVKTMDGTLAIDSGRGGGTTITIDIPLKKKEK